MQPLGLGTGLESKTVVVQGLGNVGYNAAKLLQYEGGATIVGVSEIEGAIVSEKGIDVEQLMQHRQETGSILNFPGATNLDSREQGLELKCDILVPAALENVITMDNAPRIQAKIIAEAANGPIAAEASTYLYEKGTLILPDAYINAGGVTVSYFEWLKNLSHVRFGRMQKRFEQQSIRHILEAVEKATGCTFPREEITRIAKGPDEVDLVNSGLEETMIRAFHRIRGIQHRYNSNVDLRTASFIDAIDKIVVSYQDLGIFP